MILVLQQVSHELPGDIHVVTDSQYVVSGAPESMRAVFMGFNDDLWRDFREAAHAFEGRLFFIRVKCHRHLKHAQQGLLSYLSLVGNGVADQLAGEAADMCAPPPETSDPVVQAHHELYQIAKHLTIANHVYLQALDGAGWRREKQNGSSKAAMPVASPEQYGHELGFRGGRVVRTKCSTWRPSSQVKSWRFQCRSAFGVARVVDDLLGADSTTGETRGRGFEASEVRVLTRAAGVSGGGPNGATAPVNMPKNPQFLSTKSPRGGARTPTFSSCDSRIQDSQVTLQRAERQQRYTSQQVERRPAELDLLTASQSLTHHMWCLWA